MTNDKPADGPSEAKHLFAVRAGASLARLHGHPSNGADMTEAAEFFEQQSTELARLRAIVALTEVTLALEPAPLTEYSAQRIIDAIDRLRAESMRGAVEALEWAADVFWNGSNFLDRRKELLTRIAELKQQSATPQPDH